MGFQIQPPSSKASTLPIYLADHHVSPSGLDNIYYSNQTLPFTHPFRHIYCHVIDIPNKVSSLSEIRIYAFRLAFTHDAALHLFFSLP